MKLPRKPQALPQPRWDIYIVRKKGSYIGSVEAADADKAIEIAAKEFGVDAKKLIADKPMFRDAFKRHRCIIPANGYYEWEKRPDGKQPFFINAADGSVLSFAGLWDRWKNPETGEPMTSCAIIVTEANALTRPVHDRMPVILDGADIGPWLDGSAGTELLRPAPDGSLRMWPVSRRVNKTGTGDDDPTLLDEVAA